MKECFEYQASPSLTWHSKLI